MRRALVALFLCLLSGSVLPAQDFPRAELFGGYSYLHIDTQGVTGPDLDAECNLLFGDGTCPPGTFRVHNGFYGWDAALQVNANRWLGVKADFSGHYGSPITLSADAQAFLNDLGVSGFPPKANSYSYLFGPVVSQRFERYTVFGHALFGANRVGTSISSQSLGSFFIPGITLSDTAFAMAFGGGVDFRVSPRFSVRGQADYLYTGHDFSAGVAGVAAHQNNLRASVGIVYSFGGKTKTTSVTSNEATHPSVGMNVPSLGITVRQGSNQGAEVTEVAPNGPGATAGLHTGDVIDSVDGKPVATPAELTADLANHASGDKIKLGYMIRGQWQTEALVSLGNH